MFVFKFYYYFWCIPEFIENIKIYCLLNIRRDANISILSLLKLNNY